MKTRTIAIAGALLAATTLAGGTAYAQATPTEEQTSEDLICQLSDQCSAEAVEPEVDATDAAETAAVPTAGGARISATRGFSLARKAGQTDQASVTKPKASSASSSSASSKPRLATQSKAAKTKATSMGASSFTKTTLKPIGGGRADLRVSFVTGSDNLTVPGQQEALKFVQALNSPLLDGMRFTIEGHTDAVGGREFNLDLSRRRAQSLVSFLIAMGANPDRFDVVGYGPDRPLPGTGYQSAANRRVEVVRNK